MPLILGSIGAEEGRRRPGPRPRDQHLRRLEHRGQGRGGGASQGRLRRANAAWLALYSANRAFYVLLQWDDGKALQRRNAAGDDWENVTDVIVGPKP